MGFRLFAGALVHALTASGAVFGLLALQAAASGDWSVAFVWLGVAAIVDGVDGPIARRINVEKVLPRFSGARLDLVVDYLNYCVVPAFIMMRSGVAGQGGGVLVAAAIVLSSLFHFADLKSKTDDGFFVGFPAIWNVIALYFFVFDTPPPVTVAASVMFAVATFIPLKWVHPFRVTRWRAATWAATLGWTGAAAYEVLENFPGFLSTRIILVTTAAYFMFVGFRRSFGGKASR